MTIKISATKNDDIRKTIIIRLVMFTCGNSVVSKLFSFSIGPVGKFPSLCIPKPCRVSEEKLKHQFCVCG